MDMRRWIGPLVVSFGAYLLAPTAAHALGICDPTTNPACGVSDILEVVDGNGNIMTDLNGNPAIVTVLEGSESGLVSLDVEVPDIIPLSTFASVQLVEQAPDPVTLVAPVSDVVGAQLLHTTSTAPALLVASLLSNALPQPGVCATIGVGVCTLETGGLQDVTAALFPGRQLSFHILVQSAAAVPEPGTLLLLGFGLAGLRSVGARRRA